VGTLCGSGLCSNAAICQVANYFPAGCGRVVGLGISESEIDTFTAHLEEGYPVSRRIGRLAVYEFMSVSTLGRCEVNLLRDRSKTPHSYACGGSHLCWRLFSPQMTNRCPLVRLVLLHQLSPPTCNTRCSTDNLSFLSYLFFTKCAQEPLTPIRLAPTAAKQACDLTPGNRNGGHTCNFATMWAGFCGKIVPLASIPILHFDLSCRWTACVGGSRWGRSFEYIVDHSYEASQDSISTE